MIFLIFCICKFHSLNLIISCMMFIWFTINLSIACALVHFGINTVIFLYTSNLCQIRRWRSIIEIICRMICMTLIYNCNQILFFIFTLWIISHKVFISSHSNFFSAILILKSRVFLFKINWNKFLIFNNTSINIIVNIYWIRFRNCLQSWYRI